MIETRFNVGASAVIQLGEDLYKNVYGVLIEYITNSYDADATMVDIKIDRSDRCIVIKDNGNGMSLHELSTYYLDVGLNRRKKLSQATKRGRLVTGRKGFGKLACFGLFNDFLLETVKDGLKCSLKINTGYRDDGEFFYDAYIDDVAQKTDDSNGTTIWLLNNEQAIPENNNLAESIAKRLNIMYGEFESNKEDKFIIKLEDKIIDKKYRDEFVLNQNYRHRYILPDEIDKFLKNQDDVKYFKDNKISGVVIARDKTAKIKENKGVVLFARGKLCQEETYLGVNTANSYGYAHLYAEFYIDYIDDEIKDNIGTDRTALKETPTTKRLFEVLSSIVKAYAHLYDEDEKRRKDSEIEKFKTNTLYSDLQKSIDAVTETDIKKELTRLLDIKIRENIQDDKIDIQKIKNFKLVSDAINPTYSVNSELFTKQDIKDNFGSAYDKFVEYLRKKYSYTGKDGRAMVDAIFGKTNLPTLKLALIALNLTDDSKDAIKNTPMHLAISIVNMRNAITHNTDRSCINKNISIENAKRFVIMVDLFIEFDKTFMEV